MVQRMMSITTKAQTNEDNKIQFGDVELDKKSKILFSVNIIASLAIITVLLVSIVETGLSLLGFLSTFIHLLVFIPSIILVRLKKRRFAINWIYTFYFTTGISLVLNELYLKTGTGLYRMYYTTCFILLINIYTGVVAVESFNVYFKLVLSTSVITLNFAILIAFEGYKSDFLEPLFYSTLINTLSLYLAYKLWKINHELIDLVREKDKALMDSMAKVIDGFIPICAQCKSIRSENGEWSSVETYINGKSSNATFTHGLCDVCAAKAINDIENGRNKK